MVYNQAFCCRTYDLFCVHWNRVWKKENLFLKINLFLIGLTLLEAKTSCIAVAKDFVSYVT